MVLVIMVYWYTPLTQRGRKSKLTPLPPAKKIAGEIINVGIIAIFSIKEI